MPLSFAMKLKDELTSLTLEKNEEKILLMGMLQVNASIGFSSNGLYLEFSRSSICGT